jgi:hypothetical protein
MQPNSPSRVRTASEEMLEIFFASRLARKSFARAMNPSSGDCRGRGFRRDTRYLEKRYGVSLANLNRLALMATKSKDSVVADSAFKRIGDSWDKQAWTTEVYFNQNKTWAAQIAPAEARSRGILQEAAANLQSEGGAQYQKNMEQAMLPLMRQCAQSSNDDQGKFELVVQVGKDGGTEDAWPRHPTALAMCILRELHGSHIKKETPFPPPPHPAYWLDLQLDPAAVNTAAAN